VWIKICGLTDPRAVSAALGAGADALGFVLAASPRQLRAAEAAQLAQDARRALCVAVMRHPSQQMVDDMLREFTPDALQTDWEDFEDLSLPATLGRLPVVRGGHDPPAELPDRLLFEGPVSGAGVVSDWSAAQTLAMNTQLVLAGGLKAGNVAAALAAVKPFGIDVSSGVERRLGVKDPAAIESFIATARAAARAQGIP
jgi:phosphoribosylanthranilate isomerase